MLTNNLGSTQTDKDCLEIYTLGHFAIKKSNHILTDDCKRSRSLWNLFNYILAYRDKHIVQEEFFDLLWPDENCANPSKALQNLVYRLRMIIDRNISCGSDVSIINFSQGCYSWNMDSNCWIDINEFETTHKKALKELKNGDEHKAAGLFLDAIKLYKGEYLAEYSYNEWVIPLRNHYQRIYLDSVNRLIQIYKGLGEYEEIISICEKAISLEPLEEGIHCYLVEALIEKGEMKQAQNHYEYVSSMLYKELGIKPSAELRRLYHRIRMTGGEVSEELATIQESIKEEKSQPGAFYCDPATFRSLYKLEARRMERTGKIIFIIMFTIHSQKSAYIDNTALKRNMKKLQTILIKELRKGDVITKWSESQLLALLPGISFEKTEGIATRIEKKFNSLCAKKEMSLKTKLLPIEELQ